MPALVAFIASFIAKLFADKVLGWIALKAVLTLLCVIILPVILNNFLYDIIEIFMNFAGAQTAGAGAFNGSMNFTGLAAWFIDCFKISQCLSVLIGALLLRVALSMIPFVRMV